MLMKMLIYNRRSNNLDTNQYFLFERVKHRRKSYVSQKFKPQVIGCLKTGNRKRIVLSTNPQEENCVSQTKVTIGQSNRSSSNIPEKESSWRQDENPLMKYLAKDTAQTGIANKDVRQKSVKEGQ